MISAIKKRYHWIIVLSGLLVTFAAMGVVNSTTGVLVKPVCEALGLTRSEFTLHKTIMFLASAPLLPVFGKMCSRIGVKRVMLISAIGIPAISFAYSFSTNIWHFYIIALVNSLFINGANFMTVGVLISNWFDDKRGFATGIAYAGSGFGAAALIPVVSRIAESYDWQSVYRFVGIASFAVLIPVVLLLVRERPEDMGLKPYRDRASKEVGAEAPTVQPVGLTSREAMKTPVFWLLIVVFFLLSIMAGGPNTHSVAYLTDIGYSAAFAAVIMSVLMLTHTLGNIALGGIYDRFGVLISNLFLGFCCMIFPVMALLSKTSGFIWAYAPLYGIASSGFTVPLTILISRHFGSKDFPSIMSIFSVSTCIGTAVSGPLMGAIFDYTGSYFGGWIMLAVFGVIITAGLLISHFMGKRGMASNTQ